MREEEVWWRYCMSMGSDAGFFFPFVCALVGLASCRELFCSCGLLYLQMRARRVFWTGTHSYKKKNRSHRADQTIPVNRLQPSAKQNATIEKNNQRQQHCTNTMSEVRAAHLLIKHTGSRNPTSRRTGLPVTITPDQAMNEINYYLSQIQNHPDGVHSFPTFARERSDCSSFRNDGDLGVFGRGMMQRPFEESAFGLGVEEMSGVVSTDSGLHLIYRIA